MNETVHGTLYTFCQFGSNSNDVFPQTVWLTLRVLTVMVKGRGDIDRGGGRNLSLFTYFRACMFVFRGDSRTFGLAAILAAAFFVVILVLSGSSSMFIFRGNSRAFRVARIVARRYSW